VFKYWSIERKARRIRVILQSGEELSAPIQDDDPILNSEIDVSIFDWEKWWVIDLTKGGDLIFAEAYSPNPVDHLHGRPTIYLDQNHWRTVADAHAGEGDPANPEIAAALELAALANDGRVIVPISSAHVRETAPLYGDRRYKIGVAMARLAGGWQLRNPTHVWRNEMLRMICGELGRPVPAEAGLPVITLEPHALLDDDVAPWKMDASDTKLFLLALSSPSIILELLLDPESQVATPITDWVQKNQSITDFLAQSSFTKAERRRGAYGAAWHDASTPLQAAMLAYGIPFLDIEHLISADIPRLLSKEPMTRYFAHLSVLRHIDATSRWHANDLTDMLFLSCAAGYATYVVAEHRTGSQLQQAQRTFGERDSVHRSLVSLMQAIRDDGVADVGGG
jgi:hypothetical protein